MDIDKLEEDVLTMLIWKINEIEFTRVAFISPSGNGVKIIVKVDSGMEAHGVAYKQVADFLC